MRTIVAFLLIGIGAAAQGPDISQLQRNVDRNLNNVGARTTLLQALLDRNVALPADKVRELRLENILWLIEHHSEAKVFDQAGVVLSPSGRLADPAGVAEAIGLWKEIVSKPGAKAVVIANAAIYMRITDIPGALALLANHSAGPEISFARGFLDATAILGLSGVGQNANFATLAPLRETSEAKAALEELRSSTDSYLLAGAGIVMHRSPGYELPNDLTFGDDDPPTFAVHLLRRAIELNPQVPEWEAELSATLVLQANRSVDPKEKVRQLNEALSLTPENNRQNVLPNLAIAEFDAGDDDAAHGHAEELLAKAKGANQYHIAQTVLGRVAAAKGDLDSAEQCLTASITMPPSIKNAVFQPNLTLAQDIYDAGDKDAVLRFLDASRSVWKFDGGRIDRMISFVKKAPSADLVQLSHQAPGGEVIRHPAPAFEAIDADGNAWTREQLLGKVVALEFGSAPLAEKVGRDFATRGALFLRVQDEGTRRRFEVITDPTVVVIDKRGNVSGYRSGAATEAEWRNEFESGFGRGPNPGALPAPKQVDAESNQSGGKITIAWQPVEAAASYVVEWDSRDQKGWIFDREDTVRVIATADASASLDLTGFSRVRWRVFAVPRSGSPGAVSPWREIEGISFTKIYK